MGGHHNSANLLDGLGSLGVSAATGTQLVGVDGVESMTPKVQLETTTADPLFGTCLLADHGGHGHFRLWSYAMFNGRI